MLLFPQRLQRLGLWGSERTSHERHVELLELPQLYVLQRSSDEAPAAGSSFCTRCLWVNVVSALCHTRCLLCTPANSLLYQAQVLLLQSSSTRPRPEMGIPPMHGMGDGQRRGAADRRRGAKMLAGLFWGSQGVSALWHGDFVY